MTTLDELIAQMIGPLEEPVFDLVLDEHLARLDADSDEDQLTMLAAMDEVTR